MNCPHCDTPIDEHEASRCLDAWVDFVVFGAEPRIMSNGQIVGRKFFSTDIAAAWGVVAEANYDNVMKLRWYNPDGRTSLHTVVFGFGEKTEGEGESAPLAICRAALKAVGE